MVTRTNISTTTAPRLDCHVTHHQVATDLFDLRLALLFNEEVVPTLTVMRCFISAVSSKSIPCRLKEDTTLLANLGAVARVGTGKSLPKTPQKRSKGFPMSFTIKLCPHGYGCNACTIFRLRLPASWAGHPQSKQI